jgi:hypothetical protein
LLLKLLRDVFISYPYNTPEAQMRKLADYAFMLRDYRYALSIYESARKDYQNDKAFKYSAGAQVRRLCRLCLLQ